MGEFSRVYYHLKQFYQGKKDKFAKQIKKILNAPQVRDYRQILRLPKEDRPDPSTNALEGFHAQMREMLDGLRNTPNTAYIRARLYSCDTGIFPWVP